MDVCRLCRSRSPEKDIYQLQTGSKNDCKSYLEILKFCLDIEVNEEMQITKKICTKCFHNVLNFYNFKTLALETDAYWKQGSSNVSGKDEHFLENISTLEEPVNEDSKCYLDVKDEFDHADLDINFNNDHSDHSSDALSLYNEDIKNEVEYRSNNAPSMVNDDRNIESHNRTDNRNERSSDEIIMKESEEYLEDLSEEESEEVEEDPEDTNDDPDYEPEGNFYKSIETEKYSTEKEQSILDEYPCEVCNRKFSSNYQKKKHFRLVHGRPKQLCTICNKSFVELKMHVLNIHEAHKLRYECKHCGRKFLHEWSKKYHYCNKSKTMAVAAQCHICNKTFPNTEKLKLHNQRVHTREEEKRFMCQVCSRMFVTKGILKKHLRTHSEERPYKCEECNTFYKSTCTLKVHQETKHSDLQVPCTVCNKVFKSKRYLINHLKFTHNNTNSIECAYRCGLKFTRRDNCRTHESRAHGLALTSGKASPKP